jgi:signal transduction histidine kinase
MRSATATLLLMFAAAAGIIFGGVRLARHEVVSRSPADRVRLQEFADAFGTELSRLEELYFQHLSRAVEQMGNSQPENVRAAAEATIGIIEAHFIAENGALQTVRIRGGERSPEFVVEGGKKPLNGATAVVFPRQLLVPNLPRGWFGAPSAEWRVFWQTGHTGVVALLVDMRKARVAAAKHIARWLAEGFAPLREAGELVQIRAGESMIEGIPSTPSSPIALTIPFRNSLGAWEVAAWDRLDSSTVYDPASLAVSVTAGTLLALLGILLFRGQRRALRIAEERVSFVNRVSHELGTPLTNVLLNLSLAEDAMDTDQTRAKTRLRIVTEEVHRLARLVGNVLTFSRSERGALTLAPSPCIPDETIDAVLAQFAPALARRGVQVEWARGASASANLDSDALAQIAGNLISNVEKYAAQGGWLGIVSQLDDGTLSLKVSDRGPGIHARDSVRVFEPFERVASCVDEGSSGTGLGLSIARELASRMGGTLTLAAAEIGACFELRVPAPHTVAPPSQSVAA